MVAEVHNTYGERHAYLLTPGPDGNVGVDKQFYVSPFNDVSGDYAMRFTLTDHHVGVTIALRRNGHTVFDASFAGTPTPATTATIAGFALRRPLMTLAGLGVDPAPRHPAVVARPADRRPPAPCEPRRSLR